MYKIYIKHDLLLIVLYKLTEYTEHIFQTFNAIMLLDLKLAGYSFKTVLL